MFGKLCLLLAIAAVASGSPVPDETLDRSGRIIGGQDAPQGRFPWYASVRHLSGGAYICGASIISNRWVLTVAHCFQNRVASALSVLTGTVMRDGSQGGVFHPVSRIVNDPQFRQPGVPGHDVSCIQTATNIIFNTNTRAIELGSSHFGTGNAIALGVGRTEGPVLTPTVLQWVTLTVIPNSQCGAADNVMCTQVPAGRGTCSGDSGGPLSNSGVQIGIIAWIRGACGDGAADGFMRVSSYRTWILNTIR